MTTLALWLLPVAALACWRWSRLVAGALALAFGAWLVYRYVGQWEWLRWISAVTGLAGASILGRGYGPEFSRGLRVGLWKSIPRATLDTEFGRRDVLALLLTGSAAADAAALLWWRGTGEWGPLPFFQTLVLLAMIAIGLWPRRT